MQICINQLTCECGVTYINRVNLELVFKALADVSRRKLLDLLFTRDGRSLSEFEEHLDMTRFGVMKHLRVLQTAGLITTQKVGRQTFHYLNPVPVQLVYDRWVSKYTRNKVRSLVELKSEMEAADMVLEENKSVAVTKHVLEIYIRTTPEKLWTALTNSDFTEKYYYGSRVESTWETDAEYKYVGDGGWVLIQGTVLESDPPRRLVTTFNPVWEPGLDYPESRVTFEIEPVGDSCRLTLIHDELTPDSRMTEELFGGWSKILSGLKTLLETGQTLDLMENSN